MWDPNDPGQHTEFELSFYHNQFSLKLSHGVIRALNGLVDDLTTYIFYLIRQCVNIEDMYDIHDFLTKLREPDKKSYPEYFYDFTISDKLEGVDVFFKGTIDTENSASIPVLQLQNSVKDENEVIRYVPLSIFLFSQVLSEKHGTLLTETLIEVTKSLDNAVMAKQVNVVNQSVVATNILNEAQTYFVKLYKEKNNM